MDRRSWLWRRKSSEKSPSGETDSSGSISSYSERFSDDQALLNNNIQSPEVTSKATTPSIEELHDNMKALSDKLSEALDNIRAKEDLVKQHAKVAEEAVSGWEKAEAEVLLLKRRAEALTQENSALEERVGNLDSALKECLRQLRQAKEEQEQKINEAVACKIVEWESAKTELENQLVNLQTKLQNAETEAVTSTFPDLCIKLEAAENESAVLKLELLSKDKELKLRTSERDLSVHAAETASKQHLESIKKVARLEAECRRLKILNRKGASVNDQRSFASFTDSLSDCGERLSAVDNESCKMSGLELNDYEPGLSDLSASISISELDQLKNEKPLGRNFMVPSDELHLMNDFLEMERLAALPEAEEESCPDSGSDNRVNILKTELEARINRTAELEEKLEKMEEEKVQLKMSLTECQHQLEASRYQLEETEMKLTELRIQLVMANEGRRTVEAEVESSNKRLEKLMEDLAKAEVNILDLKSQLSMANEAKSAAEMDVKATSEKLMKSTKLLEETQIKLSEVSAQLANANKSNHKTEAELEATNVKKELLESRVKTLELELQILRSSVCNLEEDIQKERALSEEAFANCQKLNAEILQVKSKSQLWKTATTGEIKINQEKELALAASKFAECQKTIASLGQQLSSLANFEDLFIDSGIPIEIN